MNPPENAIDGIVSYIAKIAFLCYLISGKPRPLPRHREESAHEKKSGNPIQYQTIYAVKGF